MSGVQEYEVEETPEIYFLHPFSHSFYLLRCWYMKKKKELAKENCILQKKEKQEMRIWYDLTLKKLLCIVFIILKNSFCTSDSPHKYKHKRETMAILYTTSERCVRWSDWYVGVFSGIFIGGLSFDFHFTRFSRKLF